MNPLYRPGRLQHNPRVECLEIVGFQVLDCLGPLKLQQEILSDERLRIDFKFARLLLVSRLLIVLPCTSKIQIPGSMESLTGANLNKIGTIVRDKAAYKETHYFFWSESNDSRDRERRDHRPSPQLLLLKLISTFA